MRFVALSLALCTSAAVAEPVAEWVFSDGMTTADLSGRVAWGGTADQPALYVNRNETKIAAPNAAAALPSEAVTVEVWLAIETTVEWGSILAAYQENGGLQKGWTLGFRQSNFSFGVSTTGADDGDGRVSYARALHSLEWGKWYHVVGAYDGDVARLYVNGVLEAEVVDQSGAILYPEQPELAFAGGTDNGWRGWLSEARIYDYALCGDEVAAAYADGRGGYPESPRVTVGPYLERLDGTTARVRWETEEPSPSLVAWGETIPVAQRAGDGELRTKHDVRIEDFEPDTIYWYRLAFNDPGGTQRWTRMHEFDTTFDYTPTAIAPKPFAYERPEEQGRFEGVAEAILRDTDTRKGYALIVGSGEGRLAYELAWRTDLNIVCVDDDPVRVQRVRRKLSDAGVYGARVSVHEGPLDDLPYAQHFANLVLSEDLMTDGVLPPNAEELYRVLRPSGGVMYLGFTPGLSNGPVLFDRTDLEAWLQGTGATSETDWSIEEGDGVWALHRRPSLPGAGDWSHQYANAANTASSNDAYPGVGVRPQWFGEPGPRPMVDRGTRAPAPVSANGRLFVQADRRLFGLDAYNGTILWTVEIPDLRRANVPRDSSNMVVNGDTLYCAVRDSVWAIDGQTGELLSAFAASDMDGYDWGYLATDGNQVFGTAVVQGGLYIGADGEWYDKSGFESEKVVGDELFAIDKSTGERDWTYRGGKVINSSISIGDGRVYFVESRAEDAVASDKGRLADAANEDRYLVALDVRTGETVWEQPYDMTEAAYIIYTMYQDDTLLVLNSSDKWDLYAFDTNDGNMRWEHDDGWNGDHHGGAMQHPAIVDGKVYAEPSLIDLASGEILRDDLPGRSGRGTVSASAHSVLFRDGVHGMWDMESDERISWADFRPGCWLGIIPAQGMILAPETSAGCWCASTPIQTSIAFAKPE